MQSKEYEQFQEYVRSFFLQSHFVEGYTDKIFGEECPYQKGKQRNHETSILHRNLIEES